MPLLSLSLVAALSVVELRDAWVEQPLVTIVSEPQGEIEHHVSLLLDDRGHITDVLRRTGTAVTSIAADDLVRRRVPVAGLDALWLSCPRCDAAKGGALRVDYLHNGITRGIATRVLRLERVNGVFRLTTEKGRPLRRLRLTARRLFGRLIGIGDVVGE